MTELTDERHDTISKLRELIESLPISSYTRANLMAVRASLNVGEAEERRLYKVIREYSVDALQRLRELS